MLPIIDISPLGSENDAKSDQVIQEIASACEQIGFFQIRGHGISEATMDRAFDASRKFFGLPDESKKLSVRPRGQYRGFVPATPFGARQNGHGEALMYEHFVLGVDALSSSPECSASKELYSPNIWPDEPAGFRSAISEYWDAVFELSGKLMDAMWRVLDQDVNSLRDLFTAPLSNMTLLHYLEHSTESGPGESLARDHYDVDVMTILLQNDVPGLQVLHRNGDWIDVEPLRGHFVVNIGNILEVWSGGRFTSTMHRVLPPLGKERYSIPFFVHPNYNTVVKPLPGMPDNLPANKPTQIHVGKNLAKYVAYFDTAHH